MMVDDKLIELLRFYQGVERAEQLPEKLYKFEVDVYPDANGDFHVSRRAAEKHAAWMAIEAIGFLKVAEALEVNAIDSHSPFSSAMAKARSKREKAHRWLGFIQGTLWMAGCFTLDELKEHSHKCSDDYEETKDG